MSRGQHDKVNIPTQWWKALEFECRKRNIENVDQLCTSKPGYLSPRTIKNAFKNGEMTAASFRHLATLLDYPHSHALREAWNAAANNLNFICDGLVDCAVTPGGLAPTSHKSIQATAVQEDQVLRTQEDMPQWADHREIDVRGRQLQEFSCRVTTDSAYFRFGIKLMEVSGRVFGDGSIQSQDANIVAHIGRNNWDRAKLGITARDIFFTWFENGMKRGRDVKLVAADSRFSSMFRLTIDKSHTVQVFVDERRCLKAVVPPKIRWRAAMLAWGDTEEFEVGISDISLKTVSAL